jgi:hypothetical protein
MVKNRLGGVADFSYCQCYEGRAIGSLDGPIAQLDRVTDFYSVGCRFESCWDRQRLSLRRKGLAVSASFYRPFRCVAEPKRDGHGFEARYIPPEESA